MFFFGFVSCFDLDVDLFLLLKGLDAVELSVSFFVTGTFFRDDFDLVTDTALDSTLVFLILALVLTFLALVLTFMESCFFLAVLIAVGFP